MHAYANREDLAEALGAGVAAVLAGGLATRGQATLVVSGGSTPKRFFEHLSRVEIDWANVSVLLVDERWVPETSSRSNTALVREHLLQGPAARARFETFDAGSTPEPEDALPALDKRLATLHRPFDVVVLGMGEDGHTASFFPGGDRLAEALDPANPHLVTAMRAPGAGEPRVTLTLPPIVGAHFLAIHIEGTAKKRTLDAAQADGPLPEMPVRAVLRAPRERPVEIFWAPLPSDEA